MVEREICDEEICVCDGGRESDGSIDRLIEEIAKTGEMASLG